MRTDAHRWLGCVGFSHGIHGIHRSFWRRRASHRIHGTHRSFWRRRASHRFHRCAQIVRLRRVLWEDSLVGCVGMAGCHTLLICAHLCNLWENILRHKLLWVLWLLWEDSLVFAWGSPTEITEFTEAFGGEEPPTDVHRCPQMLRLRRVLWEDSFVAAWVWQECHTLL